MDNLVFVSGQIALKPGETALTGATVGEQTEQIFANLKAILESAGSRLDRLVKATVFLARMEDFAEMNEVYKRHAGSAAVRRARPSRRPKLAARAPRRDRRPSPIACDCSTTVSPRRCIWTLTPASDAATTRKP